MSRGVLGPEPAAGPEPVVGTGFRLLGPLEASRDGEITPVPPGRQQALLAALLLRAGEVVSAPTLMEQVWGDDTDRTVLNVCVMRLRRSLRDHDHDLVRADGNGYRVAVDPGTVDLHRFRRLREQAGRLREAGDRNRERELLREALALWRGEAFSGIASPALQSEAALILEEERLAAIQSRIDADLECGSHAEVIRELRQLIADHPYRERFWCQLLLALYRSGRQSEALNAYLRARDRLTEELGVEPGEELRELHRRILTSDPALLTRSSAPEPSPQTVPAQLPPTVAGFSGRTDQLRQLDRLLDGTEPVPTTVIMGPPGVGKTALAVHWASRHREQWPDGQLYIDLRGYGPEAAVQPIEALAYFLRSIGVPTDQVPPQAAEASALFRSLTADRKLLALLDNVATVEQVRPLLPAGNNCLTIVTSRDRLTGLVTNEGARRLPVDVMGDAEAKSLLSDAIGDARFAAEPEVVGDLAGLCGNLPLALRITAADLINHPNRGLAEHVAELRTGNRLDALAVADEDGPAVRAAFQSSYARLPEPVRRLFRLLGLFPGTEISLESAAALAGEEPERTDDLLERLVSAHLVAPRDSDRFALHDLLRLYASELAHEEDSDDVRDAAVQRLYDHYTRTVEAVARQLYPQLLRIPLSAEAAAVPVEFDDRAQALAWLETEWPNLVTAVRHAAENGPRLDACRLAAGLRGQLHSTANAVDGLTLGRAALAAARQFGDQRAEALAYMHLSEVHRFTFEHRTAIRHYERALALSRHADWLQGQAGAHNNLADLLRLKGRLAEAADHLSQATELHRRTGRLAGLAACQGNLGRVRHQMGQLSQAADDLRRVLPMHERIGSLGGRSRVLSSLGAVLNELGEHEAAREVLVEAVSIQQELDDRPTLPYSHCVLAAVHLATGDPAQALEQATTAVALARETPGGQDTQAQALCVLAAIDQAAGNHDSAQRQYQRARELTAVSGQGYVHVQALIGLAEVRGERGRGKQARHLLDRAVAICRRSGYRQWERKAAEVIAALVAGLRPCHRVRLLIYR